MDNNERLNRIGIDIWYKFDAIMEDEGYQVSTTNDTDMGRTSIAYKDNFVPMIKFIYRFTNVDLLPGGFVSIFVFVLDSNGNRIMTDKAAAIYKLDVKENDTNEDITYRFNKMLDAALKNYGRLDFSFNELETDRRNF